MKGDTVLEYAELKLTQPSTRCDLFVSANGVLEKLASGFLKPFLTHLQAVEEQVARGCNIVRLEHPKTLQEYHGMSWFTKGTLERFVRFVSTPEVLERINSLEDELAQLEQVRNIQASSLVQGADSASAETDGGIYGGLIVKDGQSRISRYDNVRTDAGVSKIELLKAMDMRLHALKQEQSIAFERAAAAGFSSESIRDLISYSEHFGAERLRTACMNFLAVFQRRRRGSIQPDFEVVSGRFAKPIKGLDSTHSETQSTHYVPDERSGIIDNDPSCCFGGGTEFDSRGGGGIDARKRWGPPENIRTDLYSYQNETNSTPSNDTSNEMSINGSPEVQSSMRKSQLVNNEQEALQNGGSLLGDAQTSSTSIQVSAREDNVTIVSTTNTSEGPQNAMDSESRAGPSSKPMRRLSVQDAISMFEKQGRDSINSSVKQCSGGKSLENGRVSLDGTYAAPLDRGNVVPCSSMPLRRWSMASGVKEGSEVQWKKAVASSTQSIGDEVTNSSISGATININDSIGTFPGSVLDEQRLTVNTNLMLPAAPHAMRMSQVVPGKQPYHHPDNVVVDGADGAREGDWRTRFKLELERSLAKEVELPSKNAPLGLERHVSFTKNSQKSSSSNFEIRTSQNRIKDGVEKGSLSKESRQPFSLRGAGGVQPLSVVYVEATQGCTDSDIVESLSASRVEEVMESIHINGNEFFGISLINPLDDTQALGTMADNNTFQDDRDPKGRFYEQYRKLRDAKLMEGHDSKRAEREAKLRVMEETLTKRKAELDARAAKLTRNSHQSHMRASKSVVIKAVDLSTLRKEQQDVGDLIKNALSLSSLPITPNETNKEVPTLKPQGGRILGVVPSKGEAPVPSKGATPPRSSGRATPSVSPKPTPKSKAVATTGSLRRSVATDNSLARSVPCFANLRKENTKPSPVRSSGSVRIHPKNVGPGREGAPMEANGNLPIRTRNGLPVKEDKKLRSGPMRKSYATDFKMLSMSSDDGVLAPLRGQRETRNQPYAHSKVRRSVAGPLQDAKPFLRKGRGSGQGATDSGGVKQKAPLTAAVVKVSDEETTAPHKPMESSNNDGLHEEIQGISNVENVRECQEVETMDIEEDDDASPYFSSTKHKELHPMAARHKEFLNVELDSLRADMVDEERGSHTISFPINDETRNRYAIEFGTETDSNVVFDPDALSLKVEDIEGPFQHDHGTTESLEDPSLCTLDWASSFTPCEQIEPPLSSVPASPPSSSVVHDDHLSPSHAVVADLSSSHALVMNSPIVSPGTFISSQTQVTNDTQTHRKVVASEKLVLAFQPKESARGFKRLLKFARKGRTSEFSSSDCISGSNTSEGDDESEVQSRFVDDVAYRNTQVWSFNDLSGNQYKEKEGAAHGVRSSIPIPPPNFRLRDEHLSRDSLLKAPRSFFSLSTFRSKGNEGKTR